MAVNTGEAQAGAQATEVDQAAGKILDDLASSISMFTVALGWRTGLWAAMAGAGPLRPAELAKRTAIAEPYVREWVKTQAAGGYVRYDEKAGTFELPDAFAVAVLQTPVGRMAEICAGLLGSIGQDFDRFTDAVRAGRGFGWHERSPDYPVGADALTQLMLAPELIAAFVGTILEADRALRAGGAVADVGAGFGTPTIAIGQAYPRARITGFDFHDGSVVVARKAAAAAGVAERVGFEVAGATDFPGAGYDLITYFDSLHDLGEPVAALRHARAALARDGVVLVVEPMAAPTVQENLNPSGRMFYAVSTLVCTPNAVAHLAPDAEPHLAAIGTQAGELTLREVAAAAGFTDVRRSTVEAPFNLVLELRP